MRPLRRRMQIIFQDPFGSLNPRMPVVDIIGEGLLASRASATARSRDKRVEDAARDRRPAARLHPRATRTSSPAASASASASPGRSRSSRTSSSATSRCRRSTCRSRAQVLNLLARPAARLQPDVPVHQPQPVGRPVLQRPGRGDVPRQARRGRRGRAALPQPAPPVHGRAAVGDPRPGSASSTEAPRPQGRRALAGRAAVRLPLPHPLLAAREARQPRAAA